MIYFYSSGQNFYIAQIEELFIDHDAIVLSEEVHSVLMFLYNSQGFSKYVDSFTKMLSLVELSKTNPCVLSPLLADIQSLRYIHITHSLFDKFAYILKCCCGNCSQTIGSVL